MKRKYKISYYDYLYKLEMSEVGMSWQTKKFGVNIEEVIDHMFQFQNGKDFSMKLDPSVTRLGYNNNVFKLGAQRYKMKQVQNIFSKRNSGPEDQNNLEVLD
ncbi:hypothetical protein GW846_03095 [Candidatus Gracilibacteria bacterium]|nr:hypothetical protein [Candidatus Gracilibacteria bacterium]